MIPVLTAQQIRDWDNYTIENEPISSVELMIKAGNAICKGFLFRYPAKQKTLIVCGKGNNGGDGLVIANNLFLLGWDISVWIICKVDELSTDSFIQYQKLLFSGFNSFVYELKRNEYKIIVDAILGTGTKPGLSSKYQDVISKINSANALIISIDIPSGIVPDLELQSENTIAANETYTIEAWKLAFLFKDAGNCVGDIINIQIGLSNTFLSQIDIPFYVQFENDLADLIKKPDRFSHKYSFGNTLIYCGSKAMSGASVLASIGALYGGSGLVTAHVPKGVGLSFVARLPEIIVNEDESETFLSQIPDLDKKSCIVIGCGLGKDPNTQPIIEYLINKTTLPIVLDADGLYFLSNIDSFWQKRKNLVLTPHIKEFDLLFGSHNSWLDRVETAKFQAKKHDCVIVLKNAYTFIINSDGKVIVNSSGSANLSKAGSGDILSGMIGGLISRGLETYESARLAVFKHGKFGDEASQIDPFAFNPISEVFKINR